MKVGWLSELCRKVKGARIQCAELFLEFGVLTGILKLQERTRQERTMAE